jgi:hypothetical protein
MTTIIAERVYEKEIKWMGCPKCKKKICEHGLPKQELKSTAKTVLSNGAYYKLKGWGASTTEEGKELTGTLTEEKYIKDGEERTSNVLTLSKPLSMVVEDVKRAIQYLSPEETEQVIAEATGKTKADEINVDDIPF